MTGQCRTLISGFTNLNVTGHSSDGRYSRNATRTGLVDRHDRHRASSRYHSYENHGHRRALANVRRVEHRGLGRRVNTSGGRRLRGSNRAGARILLAVGSLTTRRTSRSTRHGRTTGVVNGHYAGGHHTLFTIRLLVLARGNRQSTS